MASNQYRHPEIPGESPDDRQRRLRREFNASVPEDVKEEKRAKARLVRKASKAERTPEQVASDKEKAKLYSRAARARDKQGSREYHRAGHLRREYDMSPEDLLQMFNNQEGLCLICSQPMCLCDPIVVEGTGRKMCDTRACIDHDHKLNGKESVRGLLHHVCNAGLGHFRDSTTLLRNAAAYLESSNGILKSVG